jgi:nitrogen fixation/metabolism regulation signal transduction histidine kinase
MRFEQQVLALGLLAGLPGTAAALGLLWTGPYGAALQWTATAVLAAAWIGLAGLLVRRIRFPLNTVSNLLSGLREGDFSIRARGGREGDALGEVILEVNALVSLLREQRLGALEATALLRTVMAEIDVAILAFDQEERLRLVNRAGERLLGRPAERLLGLGAGKIGVQDLLQGDSHRNVSRSFPGGMGRWAIRRSGFRQGGLPHQMVAIADLSRTLREEERQAWQRLVRVLGHELNNSLAPIRSMANSLGKLLAAAPRPEDWESDMRDGLAMISSRAEALSRFMEAYSRLARLPPPRKGPVHVGACVRRAAELETRLPVAVDPGPDLTVPADCDQLDQLLINLVRNAADAALEAQESTSSQPEVRMGWARHGATLDLWVRDNGPGLESTANLFVPFFTTKPNGSGIGLALCRQIAEAHDGSLTLANRPDPPGCTAHVRLPLIESTAFVVGGDGGGDVDKAHAPPTPDSTSGPQLDKSS